jgi:hypothetical protein
VRRHYDFHTILGIVFSTFTQIVATYTHVHLSLAPPAFHWTILFYFIVLVLPSVVYFGTIAHDCFFFCFFLLLLFNEIVSVFATILLWKPFLLNRLWIDHLQIGTGTLKIKTYQQVALVSPTNPFYKTYQWRFTLLARRSGQPVRASFLYFPVDQIFWKM